MKKQILFIATSLLCVLPAPLWVWGQYNLIPQYCFRNDLANACYYPSQLDLKDKIIQVAFVSPYVGLSNNFGNYQSLLQPFDKSRDREIRSREFTELLYSLKAQNQIALNLDVLNLGIAVKTGAESPYQFSFSMRSRAGSMLSFDGRLAQLILGNKQFENQTVDFGKNSFLTAAAVHEYAFGVVFPVKEVLGLENIPIRFGSQLKYFQLIAGIDAKSERASLFTSEDRLIFDMNYTLIENKSNFNAFKGIGGGVGLDLGATVDITPNIEATISLLNIGKIQGSREMQTTRKDDKIDYEGIVIKDFLTVENNINIDTLIQLLDATKENSGVMKFNPGTAIALQGIYKIPKQDRKGRTYDQHALYLSYWQGLKKSPFASTVPFVNVGYQYNLNNFFNIGANITAISIAKTGIGGWIGINAKTFRWSIGSNQLSTALTAGKGKAFDFYTSFLFTF